MALEEYRRKRKFARTPEPAPPAPPPGPPTPSSNRFYIQRHSARRLHYDLRLEMNGVLKSWAVPKGPTLDPAEKRLAVLVEDHPMEYGEFEGTIPEGNYGAGAVMLWDRGTYEWLTERSPAEQWERGDLKFRLHGEKLMGEFALVRLKNRGKGNEWLLLKKKDFAARAGWNSEDYLESVASGARDLEGVSGAVQAPIPRDVSPMLATSAAMLPEGADWIYEVKWDGYRALCFLDGGKVRLRSRRGIALEKKCPELAEAAARLPARQAIVDGEIVAFDEQGRPSFGALQRRFGFSSLGGSSKDASKAAAFAFFAFDLIYLDGYDLRQAPLVERKRLLHALVRPDPMLRYSEHFTGHGAELLEAARQNGLEGVMAKRALSRYQERRTSDWLKIKFVRELDFVVVGWTEGERSGFGSLVLALYRGDRLTWVGNVGSGFSDPLIQQIKKQVAEYVTRKAPFSPVPAELREAHWLRPEMVVTVKFSSWTDDEYLRAPVFLRMRPDADPRDCVGETDSDAGEGADVETHAASSSEGSALPRSRAPLLAPPRKEVILPVSGQQLKFTNLDKVFYPREGYTKRDVINFYAAVHPLLLPHLRDRPLSLKRYPNGIDEEYFFQKDAATSFPKWLRLEPIQTEKKLTRFVLADDEAALLYLANLGCIDQNPWMSRVGSLEHPDFVLIDLDPVACEYDRIVEAAQVVRSKLEAMHLEGFPKTTGGDGMHIYVPIESGYSYEQTRTFAEILARLVAHERPDLFTTPRTVSQREKGKVYFDYLQNREGSTISAPYVLRAYAGAPVSTPLRWTEVVRGLVPAQFHIANVLDRFDRLGDLFAPVLTRLQTLEAALARLSEMLSEAGKRK